MRMRVLRSHGGRLILAGLVALFCWSVFSRVAKIWRWYAEPPSRWLGVDSCPRCYGVDACAELEPYGVKLSCDGGLRSVLALLGDKNVLFSCSRTYGDVVVKRLGHDARLRGLDERVCGAIPPEAGCDFGSQADAHGLLRSRIRRKTAPGRAAVDPDGTGLVVCPSSDAAVDALLRPFLRADEPPSTPLNAVLMVNAWTLVNVNAEPILLKYIEATATGWPVPRHLGSCGRVAMQTYRGRMLREYLSTPWSTRAKIAINLLKAADLFTFNHTEFRFYLTDVSPENIVVSSTLTWELAFVDLGNVILVHRNTDVVSEERINNHTSEAIECPDCFAFSTETICQHDLSDHNHYAFCKFILEEVLNDPFPVNVTNISPKLQKLLLDCNSPSAENPDRFTTTKALLLELEKVILNI